ncbi:hypothetical protein [Sphingomicrobium flavum]|uniref:hypothetical protein n=1 Tax=Sphingomicrobium flavum TaxID=1229164 RepID=UPI0021ADDD54|nr:hypothetical protein [Sphingomicrobium flavum]
MSMPIFFKREAGGWLIDDANRLKLRVLGGPDYSYKLEVHRIATPGAAETDRESNPILAIFCHIGSGLELDGVRISHPSGNVHRQDELMTPAFAALFAEISRRWPGNSVPIVIGDRRSDVDLHRLRKIGVIPERLDS